MCITSVLTSVLRLLSEIWWSYEHLVVICYFHTADQNCGKDLKYKEPNATKQRKHYLTSPDVTPSGWLGSKHQLTNRQTLLWLYAAKQENITLLAYYTCRCVFFSCIVRMPDCAKNSFSWNYDQCQLHASYANTSVLPAKIKWYWVPLQLSKILSPSELFNHP